MDGVIFPSASLLSIPVQPKLLAPASHRDCNSTGGRSWGHGNNSHVPESNIAFLTEKVIASAEEIKHHNETTIKRGPLLTPWIANIADVAPSPAGHERSDSANTAVAPGNLWRVWMEPCHKLAPLCLHKLLSFLLISSVLAAFFLALFPCFESM